MSSDVKPISVRVSESLHMRVKGTASLRGTNLERAYAEALETWLGQSREREPDVQYAMDLLSWLRRPRLETQREFGKFVIEEFERERERMKRRSEG